MFVIKGLNIIIFCIGILYIFMGSAGCIVSTFEVIIGLFTYQSFNYQILWRSIMHVIFIPLGIHLMMAIIDENPTTVIGLSIFIIVVCINIVAIIGLALVSLELELVKDSFYVYHRLSIYTIFQIAGFILLPIKR